MAKTVTHPNTDTPEAKAADDLRRTRKINAEEWEEEGPKLFARMSRAKEEADAAAGTPNHPRLQMAYEIAVLRYNVGQLRQDNADLLAGNRIMTKQLDEAQDRQRYYEGILDQLPHRILALENSHAFLTMSVTNHKLADNMIKAYEMGRNSNNVATKPQEK